MEVGVRQGQVCAPADRTPRGRSWPPCFSLSASSPSACPAVSYGLRTQRGQEARQLLVHTSCGLGPVRAPC